MEREKQLKQIAETMDSYYKNHIDLEIQRQHRVLFDDIVVKGVAIYDNGAISEAQQSAFDSIERLLNDMVMDETITEEERDFIVEQSEYLDR